MATTENFSFVPYTSIPASLDQSTAVKISGARGQVVWVGLKVTAGTGDCTLIYWDTEMGEWMPYDRKMTVDIAVDGGKRIGRWLKDAELGQWFQLVVPGGITVEKARMRGITIGS